MKVLDTLKSLAKDKDITAAFIIIISVYGLAIGILGFRLHEYFSGPTVRIGDEIIDVNLVHRWASIYGSGENAYVNVLYVGSEPDSRIITKELPGEYYDKLIEVIKEGVQRRMRIGEDYFEHILYGNTHTVVYRLTYSDAQKVYGSFPSVYLRYVPEVPKLYSVLSWKITNNLSREKMFEIVFGGPIDTSRFKSPNVYVVYFIWYNGIVGIDFLEPYGLYDALNPSNIVLAGQSFIINQSIIDFVVREASSPTTPDAYSGVVVFSANGEPIFLLVRSGFS